jgi:hypothetical protein
MFAVTSEQPCRGQGFLALTKRGLTMSKLMILFVLLVSGSLYDPPRVLSHLGPGASALGWHIKTAFTFR